MNWYTKIAGTPYPNPLKFTDENTGYHHGQSDNTLWAKDSVTGQVVGRVDYSIYDDIIQIQMIQSEVKRQGIATQMFNYLKTDNPGKVIQRSGATPEGAAWRNAVDPYPATEKIMAVVMEARKAIGICEKARFGDCNDTVEEVLSRLKQFNIAGRRQSGEFQANRETSEFYDHTWIEIGNDILDPTVDQFFSSLDIDMITRTPGVYFSDPNWDGPSLADRYVRHWGGGS